MPLHSRLVTTKEIRHHEGQNDYLLDLKSNILVEKIFQEVGELLHLVYKLYFPEEVSGVGIFKISKNYSA